MSGKTSARHQNRAVVYSHKGKRVDVKPHRYFKMKKSAIKQYRKLVTDVPSS